MQLAGAPSSPVHPLSHGRVAAPVQEGRRYRKVELVGDGWRLGNRFSPDFTAITRLDAIVAEAYPPPANPEERSP